MEISPQRGVMMQSICKHIQTHGGSALIGDYGHWGEKEDTFRVCIYVSNNFPQFIISVDIFFYRDFVNMKLLMHFLIQEISI